MRTATSTDRQGKPLFQLFIFKIIGIVLLISLCDRYGYISFEKFVDGCRAVNAKTLTTKDLDAKGLPTLRNTIATTAILEAGRISIDEDREVRIESKDGQWKLV